MKDLFNQAAAIPYRIFDEDLEVLLISTSSGKNLTIPNGLIRCHCTRTQSHACCGPCLKKGCTASSGHAVQFFRFAQGAFQPGGAQAFFAKIFRMAQKVNQFLCILFDIFIFPFAQGFFFQFLIHRAHFLSAAGSRKPFVARIV